MPFNTGFLFTYDSGEFERNMDDALALADWRGFAQRRKESEARGKLRGIGLANAIEIAAGPVSGALSESAEIRFDSTGSVTVANSGAGSIWEATTVGLAAEVGGTFTPVPYDGGATAVSAAASGETDAAVSGLGEALAQGDAVRILAVLHDERHPDAPDVPTAQEAIGAEVVFGGWGGIYAPKDLPDDVKSVLESAVEEAVASDSYQQFQADAGNLVVYRDSAEWTTFVEDQFTLFQELLG